MLPLNAIDAVAPAFTRTHQTLFQPFRWGRSWKLAASQYLGFAGGMFLPFTLFFLMIPATVLPMRHFLLVASLIPTAVFLIVLYFCARMELVAFEMVVTRGKFVGPMWRRYSARIWPWLGLKVVVGTVYTMAVVALFYAPIRHLVEGMIAAIPTGDIVAHGSKPDPEAMQAFLGPLMADILHLQMIGCALALVLKIPSTLLNDFVLPFYALEDIPLSAALSRGMQVMAADPLQTIVYLILKPILFAIGYIMQTIALQIAMIPFAIVFLILTLVGGVGIHLGSKGGSAGVIVAAVLLICAFVFFIFYATIFAFGYLLTLLEAYGIYFLGGRYRLLGDLLEPGPDKPFTPPPVFPSDEERSDDDGGPPMPMDPAVA
jgi:hypothetical protein